MRKIKCIIGLIGVFLMLFASCTNEELLPHDPDGPVLNQGRVVFNVNTGKSTVYTRASADDEQAIRSLGVFIVKPDGNLAEGITRFYEAKALTDKKLAVSIPVDIMETPG
ncbi:fimbrillin family protein, partial [Bacteroides fragilis]